MLVFKNSKPVHTAKHIAFWSLPSQTKTSRWAITANANGCYLGDVRWFARWYGYAFFPANSTVFEKTCLRDIAEFCEAESKKYRAKRTQ